MFVIEGVGCRDRLGVPAAPAAALVAADEQDRHAPWVKDEEHAHVPAARTQLLHVWMARAFEGVHQRAPEGRAAVLQQLDRGRDALLLLGRKLVPSRPERVGVLDSAHLPSITQSL